MVYELTGSDLEAAFRIGSLRQGRKEGLQSTRNLSRRCQSSLAVHILGAKGEIAVARVMGWEVDTSEIASGDGGCDFKVESLAIDVQTASYRPAHLKYDSAHPLRADIAILVEAVNDWQMDILGWIARPVFERVAQCRNYGHGPRLFCDWRSLSPLHELFYDSAVRYPLNNPS